MPLSISVNVTVDGSLSDDDVAAATLVVNNHNSRLPEGDQPLPTTPNAALATSYETAQSALLAAEHLRSARQAKEVALANARQLWFNATDTQRQAAVAALGG